MEESVCLASTSRPQAVNKNSQDRKTSRNHGRTLVAGSLTDPGTASFLIKPRTASLGMVPPTMR